MGIMRMLGKMRANAASLRSRPDVPAASAPLLRATGKFSPAARYARTNGP